MIFKQGWISSINSSTCDFQQVWDINFVGCIFSHYRSNFVKLKNISESSEMSLLLGKLYLGWGHVDRLDAPISHLFPPLPSNIMAIPHISFYLHLNSSLKIVGSGTLTMGQSTIHIPTPHPGLVLFPSLCEIVITRWGVIQTTHYKSTTG